MKFNGKSQAARQSLTSGNGRRMVVLKGESTQERTDVELMEVKSKRRMASMEERKLWNPC
jgi:hypothetical protein